MDVTTKKTKLRVELADTELKRSTGLMNRKRLPINQGMLFDFKSPRPLSFWMSNTYIPLSVAFIDNEGVIGQIENMHPLTTRAHTSSKPFRYALEVNAGWFSENQVGLGSSVGLPQDTGAQQPERDISVELVREYKDILEEAARLSVPLIISYKNGPEFRIDPPYYFIDSQDGGKNDIIKVRTEHDVDYEEEKKLQKPKGRTGVKSFEIEEITSISDLNHKNITNIQQINQLAENKQVSHREKNKLKGLVPDLFE